MKDFSPYEKIPTLNVQSLPFLLDGPSEIDWIVDQIIPPKSTSFFAGPSGVGKTWITLELAIAIASGLPWLGKFPVKQGSVLIIDEENSDLLLRVRLKALLAQRGIDLDELPIYFAIGQLANLSPIRTRSGDTMESDDYKKIYNTIGTYTPTLTIFDSLTRVHREDENSNSDMAVLLSYVKKMTNELESSVLFTHHFVKNGKPGNGMNVRGAGDIYAFADSVLLIEDIKNQTRITYAKPRWCLKPFPPFIVNLENNDGAVSITHSEVGFNDVWEWLKPHLPLSRQGIIEVASGLFSERKIDSALSWRVDQGYLAKQQIGKEVVYSLNVLKQLQETLTSLKALGEEIQSTFEASVMNNGVLS